jgi:tRNA dimethylallyltransferase
VAGRRFFLVRFSPQADGLLLLNPILPSPLYLAGPTASGKSALALKLAEEYGGEIVNADAFQLYRGLRVCTAQPSPEELGRVPHHLYGVLDIHETFDAQRYSERARAVITEIAQRGKLPIVVGGSGLYIKALTHGLTPLPSDAALRARLAHLSAGERVHWLLHRDPAAALTVNLKNDRYVTRALEICLLTGKPQSTLRQEWSHASPSFRGMLLAWPRETLAVRINERVLQMVKHGLVAEIQSLGSLSQTAVKAIGVHEIQAHLRGECTLEEAIAAIQLATRQYARRQGKWFRREKEFHTVQVNSTTRMEELVTAAKAILTE